MNPVQQTVGGDPLGINPGTRRSRILTTPNPRGPNPKVISQSQEAEEDRSVWKIVILAILGGGLVFGATYFFNSFLLTAHYRILLLSLLLGIGFLVVTVLETFFVKGKIKLSAIAFLHALASLAVFYPELSLRPSVVLLSGSFMFFVFLAVGVLRGRGSLSNSLKVKFFSVSKTVVPKAVTGFLIFLSVVLYMQYFEQNRFNDTLGEGLVGQTVDFSRPIVGLFFSGVSFDGTVGDFLDSITENQLMKLGAEGSFDFGQLSPLEKAQAVGQLSLELKKELEKVVGSFQLDQPFKEAVYAVGKEYVGGLSSVVKSVLSLLTVVTFFLTIKGTAIFFYWFIGLTAFLLFKFLLIVGFAHMSAESIDREFVMLS